MIEKFQNKREIESDDDKTKEKEGPTSNVSLVDKNVELKRIKVLEGNAIII